MSLINLQQLIKFVIALIILVENYACEFVNVEHYKKIIKIHFSRNTARILGSLKLHSL